jgi:hypothetical protein
MQRFGFYMTEQLGLLLRESGAGRKTPDLGDTKLSFFSNSGSSVSGTPFSGKLRLMVAVSPIGYSGGVTDEASLWLSSEKDILLPVLP